MARDDALAGPNPPQRDGAGGPPLVAISILNWNGWEDTLGCLESVRRLDYRNYLVCVVDDHSSDDSRDRIKAWATQVMGAEAPIVEYDQDVAECGGDADQEARLCGAESQQRMVLVRSNRRLGATGARNVAIEYALNRPSRPEYIFFLDNDATVESQCLGALVSASRAAGAGIVGATLKYQDGRVWFAGTNSFHKQFFAAGRFAKQPPLPNLDYWASATVLSGGMLVSTQVCEALCRRRGACWNEDLFMTAEELDFCLAAHKEGYDAIVARDAVVYHGPARKRPNDRSAFHYSVNRNFVLLARQWLPWHLRILFEVAHPLICLRRAIRFFLSVERRHLAKPALLGLVDGYLGRKGKWDGDRDEGWQHSNS